MNMEREVKGIYVPIGIWEATDLTWNEKILLMEIDSYTSKGKDCYFSNEYVADLLHVKPNTASLLISSLIEKGYVKRVKFDGRRRYLESNITISIKGRLLSQSKADFEKNQRQTLKKIKADLNKEDINKSTNNIAKAFDFKAALIALGVTKEVADAWMQVRKTKKAVNTEIAFRSVQREIEKAGRPADECIRIAVERSWSGFRADWLHEKEASPRPLQKKVANEDYDFKQFYK